MWEVGIQLSSVRGRWCVVRSNGNGLWHVARGLWWASQRERRGVGSGVWVGGFVC